MQKAFKITVIAHCDMLCCRKLVKLKMLKLIEMILLASAKYAFQILGQAMT